MDGSKQIEYLRQTIPLLTGGKLGAMRFPIDNKRARGRNSSGRPEF
jgi:hypothetical protein